MGASLFPQMWISFTRSHLSCYVYLRVTAGCSRVGAQFQVAVPSHVYAPCDSYKNTVSNLEINVWDPDFSPSNTAALDGYLSEAAKFK